MFGRLIFIFLFSCMIGSCFKGVRLQSAPIEMTVRTAADHKIRWQSGTKVSQDQGTTGLLLTSRKIKNEVEMTFPLGGEKFPPLGEANVFSGRATLNIAGFDPGVYQVGVHSRGASHKPFVSLLVVPPEEQNLDLTDVIIIDDVGLNGAWKDIDLQKKQIRIHKQYIGLAAPEVSQNINFLGESTLNKRVFLQSTLKTEDLQLKDFKRVILVGEFQFINSTLADVLDISCNLNDSSELFDPKFFFSGNGEWFQLKKIVDSTSMRIQHCNFKDG